MAVHEAARARRRAHLALFDATTLTAKALKEELVARSFPIASVRLFTSQSDPDHNLTEFAGEAMLVTEPDPDALGRLDIAFLCGGRREASRYLDWPGRKGFVAIDLTTASNAVAEVPIVNASVNPEAIPVHPGLIAAPHPISQMLSSLLAPIVRGCGLLEAQAIVFQPASDAGEEGIEELYRQTLGILNFQDLPRAVFGRQLAFNLIPSFLCEAGAAPGRTRPAELADEVLRITGGSHALSLEVVLAPVFHCHAVAAHLRLPPGTRRSDLLDSFKTVEQVRLGGPAEPATPVDRAGKAGIVLAGARPATEASSFWIWAVNDDLKSGTAWNAVRIAESLLERGLGRSDA